jgi:hypothetical protein
MILKMKTIMNEAQKAFLKIVESVYTDGVDARGKPELSEDERVSLPKIGSSLPFMLNQHTRCQDNILLTQKFRKFLKP